MKALSPDEYDMLRQPFNTRIHGADFAKAVATCDRLVKRGCYTLNVVKVDGATCYSYTKTPLGHLALRVSRPEMAFTI